MNRTHIRKIMSILSCVAISALFAFEAGGARKIISLPIENPDTPDFAYPATVVDDSEKEITTGLGDCDWVKVLRGVISLTIAKDQIDKDNAPGVGERIDSIASIAPQGWNSLFYVLEGALYSEIYNARRSVYDNRVLSAENIPQSLFEWSGDIFRDKIKSLVDKAMSPSAQLSDIPLTSLAPVIQNAPGVNHEIFPTAFDFITYRCVDLLTSISEKSYAKRIISVIADEVDNSDSMRRAYALTRLAQINAESGTKLADGEESAFPMLIENARTISSPASLLLLSSAVNYMPGTMDAKLEVYALAKKLLAKYPDALFAPNIKNIIGYLSEVSVRYSASNQYLSASDISVQLFYQNLAQGELVLYRLPSNWSDYRLDKALRHGTVVKRLPLHYGGGVLFEGKDTVEFSNPGYGTYFMVVVDEKGNPIGMAGRESISPFVVSDLAIISSGETTKNNANRIYVVNAATGQPVKDVRVTLTKRGNSGNGKVSISYTNAEGYVGCGEGSYDIKARSGNDEVNSSCYMYTYNSRSRKSLQAQVLTDLSVYHPGDDVGFVAIAYEQDEAKLYPAEGKRLQVSLYDANSQLADSLTLTTDSSGRVHGSLKTNKSGLSGTSYIRVKCDGNDVGFSSVEISEYKAPTFYVDLEKYGSEDSDTLIFKGLVKTYSGMPVPHARVEYSIDYTSWWLWRRAGNTTMLSGEAESGSDGKFTIEIPRSQLTQESVRGSYRLNARAMSESGETQSASPLRFSIGQAWQLNANLPDEIEVADNMVHIPYAVTDIMDVAVVKPAVYSIKNLSGGGGEITGVAESSPIMINGDKLPSGKYELNIALQCDTAVAVKKEFILWRKTDKKVPCEITVWAPLRNITSERGAKNVFVPIGSGYRGAWLLIEVSDKNGLISRKWHKCDNQIENISVPAPHADNRVSVKIIGVHNGIFDQRDITVSPYESSIDLKVESLSFRDMITPGAREQWTFRFIEEDKGYPAYAMAVLSDKALNKIVPFKWSFAPAKGIFYNVPTHDNMQSFGNISQTFRTLYNAIDEIQVYAPQYDFYGYPLYSQWGGGIRYAMGSVKSRGIVNYATSASGVEECVVECADNAMLMSSKQTLEKGADDAGETETEGGTDVADIPLSDSEHPLAFFHPNLSADSNGNVQLKFDVPNFNTTWQLQLLGYDKSMRSAIVTLDAVSSKPVMIKANAPRFLRTGDVTEIRATISNNSAEAREISAQLEIVNPATGEVLHRHNCNAEKVDASATRIVSIDWQAPYDLEMVVLRVYAISGNHTDGEQVVLAILPSSQPIIESVPFYLPSGSKDFSLKLPKYEPGSKVVLQYCANPTWMCVAALPDIEADNSACVGAKVHRLYANALAWSLAKKYPQIGEAVKAWKRGAECGSDSTLVSSLERNGNLKQVALQNTPWMSDAQSETLRMMRLETLLDNATNDHLIKQQVSELQKLQNSDGGWSWCPGMESSEYITSEVLLRLGQLKKAGAIPSSVSVESMVSKGAKFCEKELYRSYIEMGKTIPMHRMVNYLYARGFFTLPAPSSDFASLKTKTLKEIRSSWKKMDVADCATSAIILHREGDASTPGLMLESLRQRATYNPETGMHYANLEGSWSPYTPLMTVARVIDAFESVNPNSPNIDRLRQWIVLEKQVQNWSNPSASVEIVSSLLNAGSNWLTKTGDTSLFVDGTKLELGDADLYTGAFTLDLKPENVSGAVLTIKSSAESPSWGGVISNHIAPMSEVKSVATKDLKVLKNIYVITSKDKESIANEPAAYAVGQLVRVTLTVVNTRDMEYVSLCDLRPACLEPVDQTSGYECNDALWLYHETLDQATNFYIQYLPKGSHVITYDCYVNNEGRYASGITTGQSLYAPTIVAHSDGGELIVE